MSGLQHVVVTYVETDVEWNLIFIENYSLFGSDASDESKPCTTSQLNSKAFYTETLGWSEDVWDFSMLDVENGQYPVLKNKQ